MGWYKNVFSIQHPGAAGDFNFRMDSFEGVEMIDVQSHNPMFTVDALESLFLSWRAANKGKTNTLESSRDSN